MSGLFPGNPINKLSIAGMRSSTMVFYGEIRPGNIPANWNGEPLPKNKGWRWFNPRNRGDSVRIYKGDKLYVVITVDGELLT